jgi:hypothetical protein
MKPGIYYQSVPLESQPRIRSSRRAQRGIWLTLECEDRRVVVR